MINRRFKISARDKDGNKPSVFDDVHHWAVVDTKTGKDVAAANCAQTAAVAAAKMERRL